MSDAAAANEESIPLLTRLLLNPWFDRVALHALARWYFPLSRAWAAAAASGGSVDALAEALGRPDVRSRRGRRALASVSARHAAWREADAAWEEAFFGAGDVPAGARVAAEHARTAAAEAFMASRSAFLPFHLFRRFPAVRWEVAGEAAVEARHGARLAEPATAFRPREAAVELSRSIRLHRHELAWLRFPSTVGGEADTAWARIVTPLDRADPPTLILLHGLSMEPEFWRGHAAVMDRLADGGVRLIRPEAPWHGRRRPRGYYGGERTVAAGPLGMLDNFEAWVAEAGALIRWARATSRGPVGIGGISLGALNCQLLAAAAKSWPAEDRPDALLLVATSESVIEAGSGGSLGLALGAAERLAEAGWTAAKLERWRPLLEPLGPPSVDPKRIVAVLGLTDDVTPYKGGAALAARWLVPRENLFERPYGHFAIPYGLSPGAAPMRRFVEVLNGRR